MALVKFLGRSVLFLASMAFITGLSLFIVGAWLMTFPVMRLSPRERRTAAIVGFVTAATTLARAFARDGNTPAEPPTGDPDPIDELAPNSA